jgi:hypothetical protein
MKWICAMRWASTCRRQKRFKEIQTGLERAVNEKTSSPISLSKRRARRLKIIGTVILLSGIIGAGIVYWTRSPDLSDDLSMVGYNKPAQRQMAILYGKQGELIEDWSNDLKQPGTQAIIIIVAATLAACGCFYFARLLDYDDETP